MAETWAASSPVSVARQKHKQTQTTEKKLCHTFMA